MLWLWLWVVVLALLLPTAYAGWIGAPYAPTRLAVVRRAFEELGVGGEDVLVDLGAGDGSILLTAAGRGARAVGYELSPIMFAVAWGRVAVSAFLPERRGGAESARQRGRSLASETTTTPPPQRRDPSFVRRGNIRILLRNFYQQRLPQDTTLVFLFLMPKHMARVQAWLQGQELPAGRWVLSYAFPFPHIPPHRIVRERNCAPLYVYDFRRL